MSDPQQALWSSLDSALEAGDAPAAKSALDALLKADPEDPEALHELALWHTREGALEEALALWDRLAQMDPDDALPLLGRVQTVLALGEDDAALLEGALDTLDAASALAQPEPELLLEARMLQGDVLDALGDAQGALEAYEAALVLAPGDVEARCAKGAALFELCRWDDARALLTELLAAEPGAAQAHHVLGLLDERRGDAAQAQTHFDAAQRLAPELYPPPTTLSEAEFDGALAQAWARLPPYAREALSNATVAVEPVPSDEALREGLSPTILGVFQGTPLDERSPSSAADHQTARIVLFQKNLERFAQSREALLEEIEVTLMHEVGHLLGFDEDELKARGLD